MSPVDLYHPDDKDMSVPPPAPPEDKTILTELEIFHAHVRLYFDDHVGAAILALPQEDKERCFKMLEDYADIFDTIFVPGLDIIEHILGKRWAAAQANPHDGINYDYDCPIIREWDEWKAKQG